VRSPLAFLFPKSPKEELVAEHIIREHHRGRSLEDILKDSYVTNRLSPEQVDRVLERPEVIHSIGDDIINEFRTSDAPAPTPSPSAEPPAAES
jgi:hypothetical protein